MTAWVDSTDAQVNLPLSASGMEFFRSSEANCDLSNYASCANGQMDIVTGQMVADIAFTLNQAGYYVLQHGANQASLKVSAERFLERHRHQVVAHDNRLWVIGGYAGYADGTYKNDVWWSQDGVTWTKVTDSAGFSASAGHQVVAYNCSHLNLRHFHSRTH